MDLVNEFLSPNFHELSVIPFEYLLLSLIAIIALARKQLKFTELSLILLFTNMALYSVRHILLFGIVVAPILSRHCNLIFERSNGYLISFLKKRSENISGIDASARGYVWVVPLILILAVILSSQLEFRFDEEKKPVDAVEVLKKEFVRGNMFNEHEFGDYIVYSAYSQYKVFFHGKIDMYGEQRVRDYYEIAHFKPGWEDVIEKYSINWIIFNTDSVLTRFLKERKDWQLIYMDKVATIFVRNVPENFDIIKRYRELKSPVP